jgi:hypothetical protein
MDGSGLFFLHCLVKVGSMGFWLSSGYGCSIKHAM